MHHTVNSIFILKAIQPV